MGISGFPYTNEGAGGENYCTITYVMESDRENGVIYTGSDDGLVHVTRDGGKSWTNITPKELGEAVVNAIEVSPHDPATVYVAAHKYKLNDFTPFAYKSTDYGNTWTKIVTGIPYGACVRVIREDDTRKGLLYAGTETGLYISYNDGVSWINFQRNLPVTPITDLKVHKNNLIAATQGRSFWVLDELQPIRSFDASATGKLILLPMTEVNRVSGYSIFDSNGEEKAKYPNTTAANPATGAVLYYQLPDSVKSLTIEIKDQNGEVVRSFSNKPKSSNSNNSFRNEPVLTVKKGLNRFAWNLRRQGMPTIDNVYIEGSYAGRKIVPGTYTVTLKADGVEQSTSLIVKADPRINTSAAEFSAQDELLAKLEKDVTDIHVAVTRMRGLTKQIKEMVKLVEQDNSKSEVVTMSNNIVKKITAWEEKLIQPKSQSYDDVINFVNKLSANVIFVHGELNGNVPYVTAGQKARYAELHAEWLIYQKELDELLNKDIAELNARCKALSVANVILPE
jgi:hypothetical protein